MGIEFTRCIDGIKGTRGWLNFVGGRGRTRRGTFRTGGGEYMFKIHLGLECIDSYILCMISCLLCITDMIPSIAAMKLFGRNLKRCRGSRPRT